MPGGNEKESAMEEFHAGQVFGRWTLLEVAPRTRHYARWWCRCTCGTRRAVPVPGLRKGTSTSCGCAVREKTSARMRTHGMKGTHTFTTWCLMRYRCTRPTMTHYENYGGRGIKVCDRWLHSFENFLEDVGERPSTKHTIDRIDSNGNYEPGNVRWATHLEQRHNRRDVVRIPCQGRSFMLVEWARELRLPFSVLHQRLRYGWSVERAFTEPLQRRRGRST